ncbi:MAG: hypothetical protein HC805_06410 [Alkalinema sp. RL_2_19]|nr:hypothetical protein [Alkalinema sp. RL_2_19]
MTLATSGSAQTGPDPVVLEYMERQSIAFEPLVLRVYGEGEPRPLFVKKVVAVEPQFLVRSRCGWCDAVSDGRYWGCGFSGGDRADFPA